MLLYCIAPHGVVRYSKSPFRSIAKQWCAGSKPETILRTPVISLPLIFDLLLIKLRQARSTSMFKHRQMQCQLPPSPVWGCVAASQLVLASGLVRYWHACESSHN